MSNIKVINPLGEIKEKLKDTLDMHKQYIEDKDVDCVLIVSVNRDNTSQFSRFKSNFDNIRLIGALQLAVNTLVKEAAGKE